MVLSRLATESRAQSKLRKLDLPMTRISLPASLARSMAILAAVAIALPASAGVLAVGFGVGISPEAARAAARADLAAWLARTTLGRRELPVLAIEFARAGGSGGEVLYEARLTDASLAAYRREASQIENRLRRFEPQGPGAMREPAAELGEWLATVDQYRRLGAVLRLFSASAPKEIELDEVASRRRGLELLSPAADAKEVAQRLKRDLDAANVARCRVIAPVDDDAQEVSEFSAAVADALRGLLGATTEDAAPCTLDGTYSRVDGRVLLTVFLLDASFNTRRAFVFALKPGSDAPPRSLSPSASEFVATLNRGLVRNAIEVNVRTGRGTRGLYYRPGERDTLLVKLDRPGYYYIVGHVQKDAVRFSYLMEIGEAGAANRFVRRVSAEQVHRWQAVGEFTVEAPLGLEAVQVFAASAAPERLLPATRLDPVRNLYLLGSDPVAAVKRTRGLVRVNLAGAGNPSGAKGTEASLQVGEAVLQFSTLP